MFHLTLVVALFFASACSMGSTPRQLATTTNAAVLTVTSELQGFKTTREQVAQLETNRLEFFTRETAQLENEVDTELEALHLAGGETLILYTKLRGFAARLAEGDTRAETEVAKLRQQIIEGRKKLDLPTIKLKTVADNLAVLGAEDSLQDHISFLIDYGKAVKDAIDKANKEKDKALKDMKANSSSSQK